jgi:hypothetical protein
MAALLVNFLIVSTKILNRRVGDTLVGVSISRRLHCYVEGRLGFNTPV